MSSKINLSALNVVVVGLAREGSAVAHFLAEQGATVTVTDIQTADKLTEQIETLNKLNISFYLGSHPPALLNAKHTDLIVVSPGVPLTIPFLQQAQANGIPLTTESRLFCQLCPIPVIGISGSNGKTTTTTLVGKMLQADGLQTLVGGNIGHPLISYLAQLTQTQHPKAKDWIVIELSSFQLEYFHAALNQNANPKPELSPLCQGWSPKIGALLNITPNHLDRHKTMLAYTKAKQALVAYMDVNQTAVLGADDAVTKKIGASLSASTNYFSLTTKITNGAYIADEQIILVNDGKTQPICAVADIKLRGQHNIYNILAACTIASLAGCSHHTMAKVATTFTGVPHRLEVITPQNGFAHQKGVIYINDSIATSPERLMAALRAFNQPIILLAGGKDKDLPWLEASELIIERVKSLILFGHAQKTILDAINQIKPISHPLKIKAYPDLAQAVIEAKKQAKSGDVVLLSPGGTSYDAYLDFAARGEHFKQLVLYT